MTAAVSFELLTRNAMLLSGTKSLGAANRLSNMPGSYMTPDFRSALEKGKMARLATRLPYTPPKCGATSPLFANNGPAEEPITAISPTVPSATRKA